MSEDRSRKRFYTIDEWLELPEEEARSLSHGEGTGFAALHSGAAYASQEVPYTPRDVKALRRHLLQNLGMEGINPLDRSDVHHRRIRTAVETWVRTPSNHEGRLVYSPALIERLAGDAIGLGVIDPLLESEAIIEITVAAYNQISVEQAGRIINLSVDEQGLPTNWRYKSRDDLLGRIEFITQWAGEALSLQKTLATVTLKDGSRITVQGPPASEGMMVIRRRHSRVYTLDDLVSMGTMTEAIADLLRLYIKAGVGMLVSGGTGAGKTTLLEAIVGAIPPTQKVSLVQESLEIRQEAFHPRTTVYMLKADPHAKPGEGASLSTLSAGVRQLGAQRFIIGEVKGAEAAEMLSAASGGTVGPMCTIHARNASQAYDRLQGYVCKSPEYAGSGPDGVAAVKRDIATLFPVCLHMGIEEGEGFRQRYITQILEVEGVAGDSWAFREVAAGQSIGGQVTWSDVPEEFEHVPAVAQAIGALPRDAVALEAGTEAELEVRKSSEALDLLAEAVNMTRLGHLDMADVLLERATKLSPDDSVILATRSEIESQKRQQRMMWMSKLEAIAAQVRLVMETGNEDSVRQFIRHIESVEVVTEERDQLLKEVRGWLEDREKAWSLVPDACRDTVKAAVDKGNIPLALAWGEKLFAQEENSPAARAVFEQINKVQPGNRRVEFYLGLLSGGL